MVSALLATSNSLLPLALTPQHRTTSTLTSIVRIRRLYRSACPTMLSQSLLPSLCKSSRWESYSSNSAAARPDKVSTSTLKHYANELSPVFKDLFNASLHQHSIPVCFKAATIIPVPKTSNVKESGGSCVSGDEGVGATVSKVCH